MLPFGRFRNTTITLWYDALTNSTASSQAVSQVEQRGVMNIGELAAESFACSRGSQWLAQRHVGLADEEHRLLLLLFLLLPKP